MIRRFEYVVNNQDALIKDRTSNLEQALAELERLSEQRQELAAARERTRIARELHDGLGHYLSAIKLHLGGAARALEPGQEELRATLGTVSGLAQESLHEIRRAIANFQAASDNPQGLASRLRLLADQARAAGMRTTLIVEGQPRIVRADVEAALHRMAQESLTNVRKHAQAAQADIVLDYQPDRVRLVIIDDGPGAASVATGGSGLRGLRERAEELGGSCSIETAPGRGFKLEIEVPA